MPGAAVRERVIEKYLRKRVRATGGECYKFVSPGRRGVPDRMCVWLSPGVPYRRIRATVIFVECKRPGKKVTPQQAREHARMQELGLDVMTVATKEQVDRLLANRFNL